MGLMGTGAPVTLPGPPLLNWTLPATFPVPWEFALLLMVTAPGTIGGTALAAPTWGTLTPVPMDPWPWVTPPPVRLEFSAVLEVPTGPGVGVGTMMGRPDAFVWPEAALTPKPAKRAAMKTRIGNFMKFVVIGKCSGKQRRFKMEKGCARRDSNPRPAD